MTLYRSVLQGVKGGLIMAGMYCAWVAILIALNASFMITTRHGNTVNAFAVMAVYVAGGAIAGAIVGSLRPLIRWRIGAIAVGVAAATPIIAGFMVVLKGLAPWSMGDRIVVLISSVLLGIIGGLILYHMVLPEWKD